MLRLKNLGPVYTPKLKKEKYHSRYLPKLLYCWPNFCRFQPCGNISSP